MMGRMGKLDVLPQSLPFFAKLKDFNSNIWPDEAQVIKFLGNKMTLPVQEINRFSNAPKFILKMLTQQRSPLLAQIKTF